MPKVGTKSKPIMGTIRKFILPLLFETCYTSPSKKPPGGGWLEAAVADAPIKIYLTPEMESVVYDAVSGAVGEALHGAEADGIAGYSISVADMLMRMFASSPQPIELEDLTKHPELRSPL